ncbi:MAG: hypothetical protein A2X25_08515 [Chloroflexi bacterium GWB2_49_20]|nr:MAG: hypothetical protein A2X25_08515 [Chloroflexi bacterium GWB2_49_20]OGN79522.1 MAG: hypothetical protein A2X26_05510 [Chloroflexi bacterium GWC2_49_37]OGN84555.1 MAG: hypothetical protein A2X27_11020 [Chloroflexi bacterium GWD2_49_16]HBG74021.1 hypothetical protein [Anaerolineae bacterium]HCC78823.1 hypothetical protein [Anaerolineae bacterium]
MSNYPGSVPPNVIIANNGENEFVREASLPLYQARGWLKFVGIMLILGGIPSALALVGIIPIWQGVLLMQAASSIETAANTGQKYAFNSAMSNIKTFFVVNGILFLIGIIIALLMICLSIVLPLVGISLISIFDPSTFK